ncbi:unnamed protein product [Prorocentrum cordatum]|uniref:Uncharacterized protein n=1 Tax=Prorocentrum cordatum TaxID=2364126 RepID=A0ABN9VIQ7_9DINO|nr:unnamed protein product [Polarella glacialis]
MSSKISRYIQCTGPLAAKAALVRQGASPRGRADVAPAAMTPPRVALPRAERGAGQGRPRRWV